MSAATPLLRMADVHRSFPGVHALRGVGLELHGGEVLALVGENGAGKSTLIKVLAGALQPDAGGISLDGQEVRFRTPFRARRAGIAVIHQELSLVPALSAAENIFLGQEISRAGWVRHAAQRRQAAALFGRLGVRLDPATPCRRLSVAQQQVVEIARALASSARILVMDEPSAALTPQEVDRLLAIIRDLKSQGIGVLYVSHRLDEVLAVADRIAVLRDGSKVAEGPAGGFTRDRLIEHMVGRRLDQEYPARQTRPGPPRLEVRGLCRGECVRDVSFTLHRGEVLGLTGLVGAGRTETARLIFGADPRDAGTISLDGQPLDIRSPRDAIRAGIGLLTEDRKGQGLVLPHPVRANFALASLDHFARLGFLRRSRERRALAGFVDSLRIRVADFEQPAGTLSGGNQQKVILARWLERRCEVLLFDEPTRGIDVGARHEIYLLVNALAAAGKSVLLISSELPEVLGMSDRILVMHEGRITGEITDVGSATQEQVLQLAVR